MPNAHLSTGTVIGLIFLLFIFNIIYYLILKKTKKLSLLKLRLVSIAQIIIEPLFGIIVILYAGGIVSIFFITFPYAIIFSAFFYGVKGVLAATVYIGLLYNGLIYGQFFNVIPFFSRYNNPFEYELSQNFPAIFTNTFLITSSLFFIGIFVSIIAKSLLKKEKEIAYERDKVTAVFGNLVDGLIYINQQDVIEMINPQAEKLLNVRAKRIVGKNVVQLKMKKGSVLKQALSVDSERGKEIKTSDQENRALLVSSSEIKDEGGNYIGTAKIIHDISREKLVDSMKSEFITIAGHQLRTPLSAIKGAVNLLKNGDYGPVTKEQKEVLDLTYEYNDRLIMLINDLLEVSSLEEGKFEYKFEPIDIHDLLREVTQQFSDEAKHKKIKFDLNIKNNLSDVKLDPYKMKLALSSIINNAITYTPKRGRIGVMCEFTDKDTLKISIHDSGIGIPKDEQDKVFTKFFRANNALRVDTEGNGLDLFVTKNIIKQHKGKIWFESSEGVGTTFYIEIPVKLDKNRFYNISNK